MILYKTELALAELQSEKRVLNLRERRILLFVNERRTLDEVRALLAFPDSGELIYVLEKKGYLSRNAGQSAEVAATASLVVDNLLRQIKPLLAAGAANGHFFRPNAKGPLIKRTDVAQAAAKTGADRPAPIIADSIDATAMRAIKHIIAETSGEHLGIFSRELLDKTERARDAVQLRACISQWHMAMQESRSGREKCVDWLSEVNGLMAADAAPALKSA